MENNKKKMRIAEFVTSETPFPIPKDFHGLYAPLQVALEIAEGLTRHGHEITFFGPRGSHSKIFKVVAADVDPLYKNSILKSGDIPSKDQEKIYSLFDQYFVSLVFREHQKRPFDIIHIHPVDRVLPFVTLFPDANIVYTLHDPIRPWRKKIFNMFATPKQYYISISNAQRKPAPKLNYAATIYNGIDLKLFPFSVTSKDFLLFVGRIQENKGVYEAIQAAKIVGAKLLIAGTPAKGEYWEKKVKPYLDKNIKYIGLVPYNELYSYYQKARALLLPIMWEEPFGLVSIEAMACGTPVIAFGRGAVPEIVEDGKTGFIVSTPREMARAIKKIGLLDRRACRRAVEQKFSKEHMVSNYERVFLDIISR